MSLHGLRSVTMGVPNVAETAAYYATSAWPPRRIAGSARPTADGSCGSCTRPPGGWSSCGSPPTTPMTWPAPRPAWPASACRARWSETA